MWQMDGFTVATEIIKKYGRARRPAISALTANSDTKTRERCYEVGMDHVLMKPINLELLRTELAKLLDFHEVQLESLSRVDSAGRTSADSEAGSSTDSSSTEQPPPAPQLHLPQISDMLHNKGGASSSQQEPPPGL